MFLFSFGNFNVVVCLPLESFMDNDKLNNMAFFYYGSVEKTLLNSDLNILLNNFDQISFDLVRYVKSDRSLFTNYDPKNHYNLILNLQHEYLNYYYSFPFSHKSNLPYYEFLSNKDWEGCKFKQYWRPYISVHDKNLVDINNIKKFNINPNNYIKSTGLEFKIYSILKMYVNK